jgi:hypothetical protein
MAIHDWLRFAAAEGGGQLSGLQPPNCG